MGYFIANSIDELNNYIHSYGPEIADEYKHIIWRGTIIVYDKEDVMNNYRVSYRPSNSEYIICKTKEDFMNKCDNLYELYKSLIKDAANNSAMLGDYNIIGSIARDSLNPDNRHDIYESIKTYVRDISADEKNDTKDIRIFPGKSGSFPNDMQLKFIAAGFNEINNEKGQSFQIKGCSEDEINYWINVLKPFGVNYKINESKFSRGENYRDIFFINNKPVKTGYFLCDYCQKIRPMSWMTTVEQIPQHKLENNIEYRKNFAQNTAVALANHNKVYACKKCATLKGDSIFPWNQILKWNNNGGIYYRLRSFWRIYGRLIVIGFIIVAFLNS